MARTVVCAKGVLLVNLRHDEKLVAGMARTEESFAGTIYAKLQENYKTAFVPATVAEKIYVYIGRSDRFLTE